MKRPETFFKMKSEKENGTLTQLPNLHQVQNENQTKNVNNVYEVFLKSWYQEMPTEIQEEIMYICEHIEDAWDFLKIHAENYMEYYPLVEIGIRLKKIN